MDTAKLSHRKYVKLVKNYVQTATVARLVYVTDADPGIQRIKKGKGFSYILDNTQIKNKELINRIRKLAIPPAWDKVWICSRENGHIQATGFDTRNRKQYRYHPLWSVLRNETKFHKLLEFGKQLPALRLQLEKDLAGKELTHTKVMAAAISIMERTYIRVGNATYEKQNGSYGLTTLHNRHVAIEGAAISFSFKGKKGISHKVSLRNKRLANVIKQCREIPGKELFQYYDENGNRSAIDSGMINQYIKDFTGEDFTAKDFRTWAGCLTVLRALKNIGPYQNATECKHNISLALDYVSDRLGNTRTVCRKYYVHPGILRLYEENKIETYLSELDDIQPADSKTGLTKDETVLIKLLAKA